MSDCVLMITYYGYWPRAAGQDTGMPFSRYCQGETSFEFLGFEYRWGVNRKGQAWLKRRRTKEVTQLTESRK